MLVSDFPVVQHGAEFFHRAIQEGLFLAGKVRRPGVQQFVPVRFAREEFAVPVHGAGAECFPFGVGQFGQPAADPAEQGPADLVQAQVAGDDQDQRQSQEDTAEDDAEQVPFILEQTDNRGNGHHRRRHGASDAKVDQHKGTDQ